MPKLLGSREIVKILSAHGIAGEQGADEGGQPDRLDDGGRIQNRRVKDHHDQIPDEGGVERVARPVVGAGFHAGVLITAKD